VAPMNNRFSFEALDRSLCDVLKDVDGRCQDELFGGKSVLSGGHFCQIILVIFGGTKEEIINASLSFSLL